MKNITVILRSAGERTEKAAMSLLKNLTDDVRLVKTTPFSAALKDCFETGISESREWTLVIDADVLISLRGLASMLVQTDSFPADSFCIQGLVFDKLFSVFRPAGNHLYKVSLLPEALKYIDHSRGILRPESHVINAMADTGYSFHQTDKIIGLHDFEQSFHDIAKKAFLHGIKHSYLADLVYEFWGKSYCADFSVATEFFRYGMEYTGELRIDSDDIASVAFARGLIPDEKKPYIGGDAGKMVDLVIDKELVTLLENSKRQNAVFQLNLWNSIKKGKADSGGLTYSDTLTLRAARSIAIFGLGESGRKSFDFMQKYFAGKVNVIIDDSLQGNHMGVEIISTDRFMTEYQGEFDLVVCGRYQKLNPHLIKELKLPLLRLDSIY